MKSLQLFLLSLFLIFISCGDKAPKKIKVDSEIKNIETPIRVYTEEMVEIEALKPTFIFTVQIRASKKKLKKYSSVENVLIFNEEGMYKYRLGSFKTYKEARSYRENLLQEFPGAFVQALKNNQPISIQEAIK
jgi:hypothetical protein